MVEVVCTAENYILSAEVQDYCIAGKKAIAVALTSAVIIPIASWCLADCLFPTNINTDNLVSDYVNNRKNGFRGDRLCIGGLALAAFVVLASIGVSYNYGSLAAAKLSQIKG